MSAETEKLRQDIRSGLIDKDTTRDTWEWAVKRIYDVERQEEKARALAGGSQGLME